MGQKVHPIGFRLGVYRDWDASWYARNSYGKSLLEDFKIRDYLFATLEKAEIANIKIEKAAENVKVIIFSGKPGMVIGRKGQEIDTLRRDLSKMLNVANVEVSVQEVKRAELDAKLVAENIAEQLVKRANFKKTMKKAASTGMKSGAKGMKICCSGRLGGAEIARSEWTRVGSVPLHTLRSDIDYALAEAKTKYGIIGVKVWICRGEYQPKKKLL
ncbi:MAG: 30S ribosomal protein S3 [Candidatus Babeliales bacterium]|nr:30S ribosomal protein S3 [Candidatus Babeliales bacterium]